MASNSYDRLVVVNLHEATTREPRIPCSLGLKH